MTTDAAAIVVAAGRGERLGAEVPKALVPLAGRPLVFWCLRGLAACPRIDRLVLVVPPESVDDRVWLDLADEAAPRLFTEVVGGGARRRDSVAAGLHALVDPVTGGWEEGIELVAVHDAARPLVTAELTGRVLDAAFRKGAAIPAVTVVDTIVRSFDGRLVSGVLDRGKLRAVQTPQAFRADLLAEAHRHAPADLDASDDAGLVRRLGHDVALVEGDPGNVKITWREDLITAERRLAGEGSEGQQGMAEDRGPCERIGLGWDVHPLVEGRSFPLAGVVVTSEFGPSGHSDGDPLSHAIADAMLGAAGKGDIGSVFPDTDPACKDIAGPEILRRTRALLLEAGWRPVQIDAVLVTDRPKIAPHRQAIREALASALGMDVDAVSVKGKRTEGLGGLAGGKGVSCQAIVRLVRR